MSRDAQVRLVLTADGFKRGIAAAVAAAQKAGGELQRTLGSGAGKKIREGLTSELQSLSSELTGLAKNAATLGGALSIGMGAKEGLELRETYRRIGFQIEDATHAQVRWNQVQAVVQAAAEKTDAPLERLADAYKTMMDRGASADFGADALATAGRLMNTTGQDGERVGRMLAALNQKWGFTGKTAEGAAEMFAKAVAATPLSLEESMEDLHEFGSVSKLSSIKGADGFRFMMGVVQEAGKNVNATTSEVSSGLDVVIDRFRDIGQLESLLSTADPKLKIDKDAFRGLDGVREQIEALAETGPRAMQAFKDTMTGREEIAVSDALLRPYFDMLKKGKEQGLSEAKASDEARKALKEHLANLGGDLRATGALQRKNAEFQSGATAKYNRAMNKFIDALGSPKIIGTIDKLADKMPQLVDALTGFIDFAVDHPMLTGVGAVAGRVGLGAGWSLAGGAAESVLNRWSGEAKGKGKGKGGGGKGKGKGKGKGGGGKGQPPGSGWAAAAGQVFGIAAAAVMIEELANEAISAEQGKDFGLMSNAEDARRNAELLLMGGSVQDETGRVRSLSNMSAKEIQQASDQLRSTTEKAAAPTITGWFNDAIGVIGQQTGLIDEQNTSVYRREFNRLEGNSMADDLAAKAAEKAAAEKAAAANEENARAVAANSRALDAHTRSLTQNQQALPRTGNPTPGAAQR